LLSFFSFFEQIYCVEKYVSTVEHLLFFIDVKMESVKACKDIEMNGGDDVDGDGLIKPPLGHATILQTTSTIVEQLATWNHPVTHEIKPLLSLMT